MACYPTLARIVLACVVASSTVGVVRAETEMERSSRILGEVSERVANQYRAASPPDVSALPQPATAIAPDEVARRLSAQPSPIIATNKTPELLVFVSFSMPRESLLRIVEQSEKTGAKMVFRGMAGNSLTDMSRRVADIVGNHRVETLIHPPAFAQFKVDRVPALVLAGSDAGNHLDNGCAQPGSYVKVTGDVSQDYALDAIERTSPQWSDAAHQFNNKLARGFHQ